MTRGLSVGWAVATIALVALLVTWVPPTNGFSTDEFGSPSDFYQLVEDVVAGRDYYALLEVTEQATAAELKRAFRTLTKRWHPDKNPTAEAAEQFRRVVFAYDVLSDPVKKEHYDSLRTKGIPWHVKYYGRYAHRYGAPEHDIRWVLFWLITTVTVLHYAHKRHRYHLALSRVKQTPTYRHRQAQLRANSSDSATSGKKRKNAKQQQQQQQQEEQAAPEESEPEVKLMGIRPPSWRDLVVVQLVLLPYTLGLLLFRVLRWAIWYKLLGNAPPPVDMDAILRERLGLTQAEYDEWKREMTEKQEKAAKYLKRRHR